MLDAAAGQPQPQFVGVEKLALKRQPLPLIAIKRVTDDRMFTPGKVDANLMGAPGVEDHLDIGKAGNCAACALGIDLLHPIVGNRFAATSDAGLCVGR